MLGLRNSYSSVLLQSVLMCNNGCEARRSSERVVGTVWFGLLLVLWREFVAIRPRLERWIVFRPLIFIFIFLLKFLLLVSFFSQIIFLPVGSLFILFFENFFG